MAVVLIARKQVGAAAAGLLLHSMARMSTWPAGAAPASSAHASPRSSSWHLEKLAG